MDGGFTNNNPADIMKKRGSNRTIMVIVGDKVCIILNESHNLERILLVLKINLARKMFYF